MIERTNKDAASNVRARQDPFPFQLTVEEALTQLSNERHTLTQLERAVTFSRGLGKTATVSSSDFDGLCGGSRSVERTLLNCRPQGPAPCAGARKSGTWQAQVSRRK